MVKSRLQRPQATPPAEKLVPAHRSNTSHCAGDDNVEASFPNQRVVGVRHGGREKGGIDQRSWCGGADDVRRREPVAGGGDLGEHRPGKDLIGCRDLTVQYREYSVDWRTREAGLGWGLHGGSARISTNILRRKSCSSGACGPPEALQACEKLRFVVSAWQTTFSNEQNVVPRDGYQYKRHEPSDPCPGSETPS